MQTLCGLLVLSLSFQPSPYKYKATPKENHQLSTKIVAKQGSYFQPTKELKPPEAMCIAAWIWQAHPVHQILLLLNRDEFHSRFVTLFGFIDLCSTQPGSNSSAV